MGSKAKEIIITIRDEERNLIEVNRNLMVENRELKLIIEKNKPHSGKNFCDD